MLIDTLILFNNKNINYFISKRERTNPWMIKITESAHLFMHLKDVKICTEIYVRSIEKWLTERKYRR